MSESNSKAEPIFEFPRERIAFEDEHGRTGLFDPADAQLIQFRALPLQMRVQGLYRQRSGRWLLLDFPYFGKLIQFAVPQLAVLPQGRFLTESRAVDWLLKHDFPVPAEIDISERYGPLSAAAGQSISGDAPTRSVFDEVEELGVTPPDGQWSEPDSPKRWAKRFGLSWDTLKKRLREQKIRHRKLSDRSYRIHRDDLPPDPHA